MANVMVRGEIRIGCDREVKVKGSKPFRWKLCGKPVTEYRHFTRHGSTLRGRKLHMAAIIRDN